MLKIEMFVWFTVNCFTYFPKMKNSRKFKEI